MNSYGTSKRTSLSPAAHRINGQKISFALLASACLLCNLCFFSAGVSAISPRSDLLFMLGGPTAGNSRHYRQNNYETYFDLKRSLKRRQQKALMNEMLENAETKMSLRKRSNAELVNGLLGIPLDQLTAAGRRR